MDENNAVLAKRFGADMRRGIAELSNQGYDATYFRRMLGDHGPVETARRLVTDPKPSYGLWKLQQMNRLDLSVEMWVLLPWYEPLFAPEVRQLAEAKLRALGVDVAAELARLVRKPEPGEP
ncbi:MAG: hypothetical protein WBA97_26645 [Actinophytocola sp.]|uniref:hypothetical protein n=1 Tax=Actinophytocola sp. TaxID=1872138 RepID=UPI003C77C798